MRDDLKIRVIIEGRFGEIVAEAIAPLQSHLTEVLTPLKMSDGAMPFFDTEPAVIHHVTKMRSDYAQYIGPKITEVLIETMRSKDTFNGYTPEQRRALNK